MSILIVFIDKLSIIIYKIFKCAEVKINIIAQYFKLLHICILLSIRNYIYIITAFLQVLYIFNYIQYIHKIIRKSLKL